MSREGGNVQSLLNTNIHSIFRCLNNFEGIVTEYNMGKI